MLINPPNPEPGDGPPRNRRYRLTDLLEIPVPSAPALRPDGAMIIYRLRTLDTENDRNVGRLWQVAADGSAPARPLFDAVDGVDDSAPAWSPDGTRLAFLRSSGGQAQLWLFEPATGDCAELTDLPLGAGPPVWSPDGTAIAFAAPVAGPGQPEPGAPIVITDTDHRADGAGLRVGVRRQLHRLSLEDQVVRQLTDLAWDATEPCWSPDGTAIAFLGDDHASGHYPLTHGAFLVAADDDHQPAPRRLVPDGARIATLLWTADGLWATGRPDPVIGHDQLLRLADPYGPETDAAPVRCPLDGGLNPAAGGGEWAGARPVRLNDHELALGVSDRSRFPLLAVDPGTGAVRELIGGGMVVGCSGPQAGRLAAVVADQGSYGEVVVLDLDRPDSGPRRLTRHTATALPEVELIMPERRAFTAADGTSYSGWLISDPDLDGPRPMLLDVHGGPHLCWPDAVQQANPYHQVLAAQGWAVLLVDPRGSDGYGEPFYTAGLGRWGVEDAGDLLTAVDTLVADGTADPDRLAVAGYSYGGFMALQLTTLTDRFRSAVAGGGISDLLSLGGSDDVATGVMITELGCDPYRAPEEVLRQSPISRVDRVRTPTLLLHAEHDHRCPIGQSEEWFAALRHRGVEVELVRYPDASHQFLVDGRPSHRLDYNRRIVDWVTGHDQKVRSR
ncbi:S9 family peptidase [Microlunatus sp. GCM10028923]|uniref:S9 family peptidase n=1 Tax=Microlunatus sp. GCM10028923 TaxID=3273400 RepID=UPI00361A3DFF